MVSFNYGEQFKVNGSIKNVGSLRHNFRTYFFLKRENKWRNYASTTLTINPGETKSFSMATVAPNAYALRIPAHARQYQSNPALLAVWNDKELDSMEISNAFTAEPRTPISIGILKYCACEGVDSNYNPINPKNNFSTNEKLYFYIKPYYDPRGYRVTFTIEPPGYLPWTGFADVPPNQNWEWYAVWVYYNPPLPKGTWSCWYKVAGNSVKKNLISVG